MRRAVRIERDYNRTLPAPVRAVRLVVAALGATWAAAGATPAGRVLRSAGAAAITLAILVPIDGAAADLARNARPGGDLRRELEAWQQFGALGSMIFAALAVWRLSPASRARIIDLAAAALLSGAACLAIKAAVGRPRPVYNDPETAVTAWGLYPIGDPADPMLRSPLNSGSELWSMPSSHTASAVVLAVFLFAVAPRLRSIAAALVLIVAVARVWTGAHYPSDVAAGAFIGAWVSGWIIPARRASRLLSRG